MSWILLTDAFFSTNEQDRSSVLFTATGKSDSEKGVIFVFDGNDEVMLIHDRITLSGNDPI